MTPSSPLRGWFIDPQDDSSLPASRGQQAEKGSRSGFKFTENASRTQRTVKVPRNVWTIGQQVYELNLIEFGLSKEVAALAAAYVRYTDGLLSLKGASMIGSAFDWPDTEEGTEYWGKVFDQAVAIEKMWAMVSKEDKDV